MPDTTILLIIDAMEPDLVLQNDHVQLRRIRSSDLNGFREIAFDPDIWTFYTSKITTEEDLVRFVDESVSADRSNARVVFTILDKASGRVAGSMSFANRSTHDGRIEIGWSWLGRDFRGKKLNQSCKFLMMRHAFEQLDMIRVEFKTDILNVRARQALKNIGCTEEGVLRSHTLMHGGRRRDTIYYSVLAPEWSDVKQRCFADLCGRSDVARTRS